MAAYPEAPFKQADSLLSGLIDSYRGSTDASDIADIQSLVETTVKIARDREYRVHSSVKELSHKVAGLEAAAVYSDAKARHEERMAEVNGAIEGAQQEVQAVNSDIRGANDQQAELQRQQKQLLAEREQLARLQQLVEPDKLKRISLYAHISGLAFDYATLAGDAASATLSDSARGEIRQVTVAHRTPSYDSVNGLWGEIGGGGGSGGAAAAPKAAQP